MWEASDGERELGGDRIGWEKEWMDWKREKGSG